MNERRGGENNKNRMPMLPREKEDEAEVGVNVISLPLKKQFLKHLFIFLFVLLKSLHADKTFNCTGCSMFLSWH